MTDTRLQWVSVIWFLTLPLISSVGSYAQEPGLSEDPVIMRVIKLDHADAEDLASSLQPFMSPQGRMIAYAPNNSLIITDRQSIVKELIRVIKGRSDP